MRLDSYSQRLRRRAALPVFAGAVLLLASCGATPDRVAVRGPAVRAEVPASLTGDANMPLRHEGPDAAIGGQSPIFLRWPLVCVKGSNCPTSVSVSYRVDDAPYTAVPLTADETSGWSVTIPPQSGKRVDYYADFTTPTGIVTDPIGAPDSPYQVQLVQPREVAMPSTADIPTAVAASTTRLAWGSSTTSAVGFGVPDGQDGGETSGPLAVGLDNAATMRVFDAVNWRVLTLDGPEATAVTLDGRTDHAAAAAVFDSSGRLIVAGAGKFEVFDTKGALTDTLSYEKARVAALGNIYKLVSRGSTVYTEQVNSWIPVLIDSGTGYAATSSQSQDRDVVVQKDDTRQRTMFVSNGGAALLQSADMILSVPQTKLLADGSIVAVVQPYLSDPIPLDGPAWYVIALIEPDGVAHFAKIDAPSGYMADGPAMALTDNAVVVLSSTTKSGATATRYDFASILSDANGNNSR
jgi:hypothetical protein